MKETSSNVNCAPDVWRSGYLPLTDQDYKEQWRTRNVMVRCGVAMYFRVESFVQHWTYFIGRGSFFRPLNNKSPFGIFVLW